MDSILESLKARGSELRSELKSVERATKDYEKAIRLAQSIVITSTPQPILRRENGHPKRTKDQIMAQAREWIKYRKTFTQQEFRNEFHVSGTYASTMIKRMVEKGWIEPVGTQPRSSDARRQGKGAVLYGWIDPARLPSPRRRPRTPIEVATAPPQRGPVRGGGDKLNSVSDKDTRTILRKARKAGWQIEFGASHIKAIAPEARLGFVTVASSPSDTRAYDNMVAEFRRKGLDI